MNRIGSHLNGLGEADAVAALMRCCGSSAWATSMASARPFGSDGALFDEADRVWWSLGREDWLEAFGDHPRIGDRRGARGWAKGEQSGMDGADDSVRSRLDALNVEYESKFGYVFLICASGLDAEAMLSAIEHRIGNDNDTELGNACEQQAKITRLRLVKLVEHT